MHYTSREVYEYISQQTNDPIVEWKRCRIRGKEFAIYQSDLDYYKKVSPVFNGITYDIPLPTLCPEERRRRRLLWRNERKIYTGTSSLSGKKIMSIYHPTSTYITYSADERFQDSRNGDTYGLPIDSSQSVLSQFYQLSKTVPHLSTYSTKATASTFSHATSNINACYLCFHLGNSEECLYCYVGMGLTRCIDCHLTYDSEGCYQCINVYSSYNLFYGNNCNSCSNSRFLDGCTNCSDCFGCVNISHASYQIFNTQYTKENYQKEIKKLLATHSIQDLQKKFENIVQQYPKRARIIDQSSNSSGCYLSNCKNTHFGYTSSHVEDCKYILNVNYAKDCMDYDIYGDHSELIYESIMTGSNCYKNAFCIGVREGCQNNYYSLFLYGSKNCFGCVGLKYKEYCIFNVQYTKQEYEKRVGKLIERMQQEGSRGEFFPIKYSPFAYNETMAQDFSPLTKDQATDRGFQRREETYTIDLPENMSIYTNEEDQKNSNEISDDILNQALICKTSGAPFRLIKKELDFYRKHNLPLPTVHPHQRQEKRLQERAQETLHLRTCDKTGKQILSVYPQDAPFKVYSEEAYQQEIFG